MKGGPHKGGEKEEHPLKRRYFTTIDLSRILTSISLHDIEPPK